MRMITDHGWETISKGFAPFKPPLGDPIELWNWAATQGSAFQLAAYFILASADACENDFKGEARKTWKALRGNASPLRLARVLDDIRRAMIAKFILVPEMMVY